MHINMSSTYLHRPIISLASIIEISRTQLTSFLLGGDQSWVKCYKSCIRRGMYWMLLRYYPRVQRCCGCTWVKFIINVLAGWCSGVALQRWSAVTVLQKEGHISKNRPNKIRCLGGSKGYDAKACTNTFASAPVIADANGEHDSFASSNLVWEMLHEHRPRSIWARVISRMIWVQDCYV